jgi:hypothetical protein
MAKKINGKKVHMSVPQRIAYLKELIKSIQQKLNQAVPDVNIKEVEQMYANAINELLLLQKALS